MNPKKIFLILILFYINTNGFVDKIVEDTSWQKYSLAIKPVLNLFDIPDSIVSYYITFNYSNYSCSRTMNSEEKRSKSSFYYQLPDYNFLELNKYFNRYSMSAVVYTKIDHLSLLIKRLVNKGFTLKDSIFSNGIIDIKKTFVDSDDYFNCNDISIDSTMTKWMIRMNSIISGKILYIPIDS